MDQAAHRTMIVGTGAGARAIAVIHDASSRADAPGIFWLPGFMSDMASTKATALAEYARAHDLGCTRFDYSGHGVSGGDFTDGTIGRWLEEARAVFEHMTTGPQIIVGSSMGGHMALILLQALKRDAPLQAARVKGAVLIAPAWDMTEELMWNKFSPAVQHEIIATGRHMRPSAYDTPYTITRDLIVDGRDHLLAREPFDPGCPVTILQGLQDPDVPAEHTRDLMTFMRGAAIKLIEIPDGEHRLSRPQDLAMLYAAVGDMAAR